MLAVSIALRTKLQCSGFFFFPIFFFFKRNGLYLFWDDKKKGYIVSEWLLNGEDFYFYYFSSFSHWHTVFGNGLPCQRLPLSKNPTDRLELAFSDDSFNFSHPIIEGFYLQSIVKVFFNIKKKMWDYSFIQFPVVIWLTMYKAENGL